MLLRITLDGVLTVIHRTIPGPEFPLGFTLDYTVYQKTELEMCVSTEKQLCIPLALFQEKKGTKREVVLSW